MSWCTTRTLDMVTAVLSLRLCRKRGLQTGQLDRAKGPPHEGQSARPSVVVQATRVRCDERRAEPALTGVSVARRPAHDDLVIARRHWLLGKENDYVSAATLEVRGVEL